MKIFIKEEVDYHNMAHFFLLVPIILNFLIFDKCPLIDIGMSVNRQYFYILYFLFLSSPILVKFKTVERLPSPGRASARHRFPWQPFTVLNFTKIGELRNKKENSCIRVSYTNSCKSVILLDHNILIEIIISKLH